MRTLKIFQNGELIGSKEFSTLYDVGGSNNLRIGREKVNGNKPFKGTMDNIRLYNYALLDTEIRELVRSEDVCENYIYEGDMETE